MRLPQFLPACALVSASFGLLLVASERTPQEPLAKTYLGFDRNEYPGDEALPILRKTFAFTSYWLNAPSGDKRSTWLGKRALLKSQGFGFVVLFNGRTSKNLTSGADGHKKGSLDARNAAKVARQEGFPVGTIIFLDIEEGGRLSAAYHEYAKAWIDELESAGFRAGVYCSAVPVSEGGGGSITTANDLQDQLAGRKLVFWVFNDVCPPSPGCSFPGTPLPPDRGGFSFATVWQYAQSPRRQERTAQCAATYAADGNCYAPGDATRKWFLDANVANSPNPSAPRE